jgi:hypothetical protein
VKSLYEDQFISWKIYTYTYFSYISNGVRWCTQVQSVFTLCVMTFSALSGGCTELFLETHPGSSLLILVLGSKGESKACLCCILPTVILISQL